MIEIMLCVTYAIIVDINRDCDCCIMVCSYLWLHLHRNRSAYLLSQLCLNSYSYLYLYLGSYLQSSPQPPVTEVVPRALHARGHRQIKKHFLFLLKKRVRDATGIV